MKEPTIYDDINQGLRTEAKDFITSPSTYPYKKAMQSVDPLNIGFKAIQKPMIMDALQDVPFDEDHLRMIDKDGMDPFDVARMLYEDEAQNDIKQGQDPAKVQTFLDKRTTDLNQRRVFMADSPGEVLGQGAGSLLGGMGEGVDDTINELELTARTVMDGHGATKQTPDQINQARQGMQRDPNRYTNLNPSLNKLGRFIGKTWAETKALGPVLSGVGKLINNPFTKTATQLLTGGAGFGFIQDPGDVEDPLATRGLQSAYGAGLSVILGGPLQGVPTALKWASKNLLTPDIQRSMDQYLSQLPIWGKRGEIREKAKLLFSDLKAFKDKIFTNGVPPNLDQAQKAVYGPINEAIGDLNFFTGKIKKDLENEAARLRKQAGSSGGYDEQVANRLDEIGESLHVTTTWEQLRNESIHVGKNGYGKDGVTLLNPTVSKEANRIAKAKYESFLEEQAYALGQGDNYMKAKILTQELKGYKTISEAFDNSVTNKTYNQVDALKFIKTLEKEIKELKKNGNDSHPLARASIRETVDGIRTYIEQAPYVAKYLKTGSFGTTNPGSGGTIGLGRVMIETAIGLVTGPIAKILTSPTMISVFQKLAKSSGAQQRDQLIKITSSLTGQGGAAANQYLNRRNQPQGQQ